jgi:biopolymer transport protein ExbB/TolQ
MTKTLSNVLITTGVSLCLAVPLLVMRAARKRQNTLRAKVEKVVDNFVVEPFEKLQKTAAYKQIRKDLKKDIHDACKALNIM